MRKILLCVCFELCVIFMLSCLVPKQVDKLKLESTYNSITAEWALSTGNFAWFIVNISSTMSENISDPVNTTYSKCYFTSLEAAALYTVTICTYVAEDLKPSHPVSQSIYTSKCE